MDLSAFKEASSAVQKVLKDYQPIDRLATALTQVTEMLAGLEDLDKAKAKAENELKAVMQAKEAAATELARVQRETERAQSVLEAVRATLSGIKL